MRVLITGITGFAGSHLADYCLSRGGLEVHGTHRWRSPSQNIEHLTGKVTIHECDLRDASSVVKLIDQVRPERVFHLAAQSFVQASWHQPAETLTTNILGQLNLFEAVRRVGIYPRIQIACSSEEYGLVESDELPIRETTPLRPASPYAVSKVAQDMLAYQYHRSYQLLVVRTRAFNHSGPRRGEVFAESNFAKQIAMAEVGLQEPVVSVGNLTAVRDYTDVRDIVQGYWLALERGEPGEAYNICTGQGHSIQEVLDPLLGFSTVKMAIRQDPARLRPSDVPVLLGDGSRFARQTGWQPQIPFTQMLSDLLNDWRVRVRWLAERQQPAETAS